MYIKLQTKSETDKAYQLNNNSWIPKSVLKSKGLKHPYYEVEGWWINVTLNKAEEGDVSAINALEGLSKIVIKKLPLDILQGWLKYFDGVGSNFIGIDNDDRRYEVGEWEMGIYN